MNQARCERDGCRRTAFFCSHTCLEHSQDSTATAAVAIDYLLQQTEFRDLCFDGLRMSGLKLSGKKFERCSFRHCAIEQCELSRVKLDLCFLEFAHISCCSFAHSDIRRSVFAVGRLSGNDFGDCELIECNFNGVSCTDTSFNDSDLFSSRFIAADLSRVKFRNCNVREVHFGNTSLASCDFRYSNIEDGYRQIPGRRL